MTTSTKLAFALAILTGFAAFPAKALEPGSCTAWKPVLGGACMTRKCAVGVSPAIHLVPESVCPGPSLPHRPILNNPGFVSGSSRGSTAPN